MPNFSALVCSWSLIDNTDEPIEMTMLTGDGNEDGIHIPILLVGRAHGNKMMKIIVDMKNSSSVGSVVISMFF